MKYYQVLDNGRAAIIENSIDWNHCLYRNKSDAIMYAKKWLGHWADELPDDWDGSKRDYNGFGDTIEVFEIE